MSLMYENVKRNLGKRVNRKLIQPVSHYTRIQRELRKI